MPSNSFENALRSPCSSLVSLPFYFTSVPHVLIVLAYLCLCLSLSFLFVQICLPHQVSMRITFVLLTTFLSPAPQYMLRNLLNKWGSHLVSACCLLYAVPNAEDTVECEMDIVQAHRPKGVKHSFVKEIMWLGKNRVGDFRKGFLEGEAHEIMPSNNLKSATIRGPFSERAKLVTAFGLSSLGFACNCACADTENSLNCSFYEITGFLRSNFISSYWSDRLCVRWCFTFRISPYVFEATRLPFQ